MANIKYDRKAKIVIITIDNPPLNLLNEALVDELGKVWIQFRDDDAAWVAIITGGGDKNFCCGYDLNDLLNHEGRIHLPLPQRYIIPSAHNIWKPTIAAISGHCLGLGAMIALDCDFKIAAEDTDWGLPEGAHANFVVLTSSLLSRYLPPPVALEVLLLGKLIDSSRALKLNLVNKVVPKTELMSSAMAMAEEACQLAPLVSRWNKELFYRGMELPREHAWVLMKYMRELSGNLQDSTEGIKAFLEKRKPEWKSR